MYIEPRSFLSRLLGAAWTTLCICGLLWLAIRLLEQIWVWLAVVVVVAALVKLVFWWRNLHREMW